MNFDIIAAKSELKRIDLLGKQEIVNGLKNEDNMRNILSQLRSFMGMYNNCPLENRAELFSVLRVTLSNIYPLVSRMLDIDEDAAHVAAKKELLNKVPR